VDALVDQWCERRCLKALRHILAGWPSPLALSDDWYNLRDALRYVLAFARTELTPEEIDATEEAVVAIDIATRRPD
jgi:hypothetical protein